MLLNWSTYCGRTWAAAEALVLTPFLCLILTPSESLLHPLWSTSQIMQPPHPCCEPRVKGWLYPMWPTTLLTQSSTLLLRCSFSNSGPATCYLCVLKQITPHLWAQLREKWKEGSLLCKVLVPSEEFWKQCARIQNCLLTVFYSKVCWNFFQSQLFFSNIVKSVGIFYILFKVSTFYLKKASKNIPWLLTKSFLISFLTDSVI